MFKRKSKPAKPASNPYLSFNISPKAIKSWFSHLPQILTPKISLPKKIAFIPSLLFCVLILGLSIRGISGNPQAEELNTKVVKENGPFELSPERGRFGLVYSMVEDNSIYFSLPLARFMTPDLGYWEDRFVSLFAPGVSLLVIPGYVIGRYFGASQVGSFAIISLFSLFNFLLIRHLSQKFGAGRAASTLGALIFLFATPAFAYAVNLYQHHISTFLILAGLALVIRDGHKWLDLFLVWFLCALSLPIDYPNLFLMTPIGLAALFKVININYVPVDRIKIATKWKNLFTFIGIILPLAAFAVFNNYSYGSPFRLSGTVPSVPAIDEFGKPTLPRIQTEFTVEDLANQSSKTSSTLNFFNPRNFINGLYILIISPDRGFLVYAPVIIFGFFGAVHLNHKKHKYLPLLVSIAGINLLLYAMWGDPWGGWAFGPRYLIPGFAVGSVLVSVFLTAYRRNLLLIPLFFISAIYSLAINTLGAITTSAIPPRVQVLELEQITGTVQKYTWERNWDMINSGHSKSFFYNNYGYKFINQMAYFQAIVGLLYLAFIYLFIRIYREKYATQPLRRKN